MPGKRASEVQGVIFDVDGTLVDSNDQHVEAWGQAFASMGYRVPRERIAVEVGKGGDKLVPAILGEQAEKNVGQELRRRHTQNFLELIKQRPIHVLPGATDLLHSLQQRGVQTVLATSSKQQELAAVEQSCGVKLGQRVDAVVTSDAADASKPAPDLVEAACGKLGLPPGKCLMVGDTPYDAQASAKAGVRCVGLLSGRQHDEAMLEEAGMQVIYRDPADLLDHLDDLLAGFPIGVGEAD